jgi:hypothetical protein
MRLKAHAQLESDVDELARNHWDSEMESKTFKTDHLMREVCGDVMQIDGVKMMIRDRR